MSKGKDISLLKDFFGTYFHQDWALDASSTEAVVTAHARTMPHDSIRILAQAVINYTCSVASDEELEEKLYTDLDCEYCPRADGLSARQWLIYVSEWLLKTCEHGRS